MTLKSAVRGAALAGTLLFSALGAASAQMSDVSEGTFHLKFAAAFQAKLAGSNIQTTYLKDESGSKTAEVFQVEGGVVDRGNGSSEVQSVGGVVFTQGNTTVQLQRLALESTDSARATVTALVILNGVYVGRHPVFTVTSGSAFNFPVQNGQVSSGQLAFKVTKQFADEINDYFPGAPPITGEVGTVALDLNLTPQS